MECKDFRYSLFFEQISAQQGTLPGLLPRLENQVNIIFCFHLVQFQRKPAQRRAVTVMPAFV